jgi:hypothetical protein
MALIAPNALGALRVPAQIALTLILAALSYRYVEMPVRRGRPWRTSQAWWEARGLPRRGLVASVSLAAAALAALVLVPSILVAGGARASAPASYVSKAPPKASGPGVTTGPARWAARNHRLQPGGPVRDTPMTLVSDSVAATIADTPPALRLLTQGLQLHLDLRVCRRLIAPSCSYDGQTPPTVLQTVTALGLGVGAVLIIDAGYNDDSSGYGSALDDIMRAALRQGARTVIWLTLREHGPYASIYQASNTAIRTATQRWPQLHVADWNRYSAGQPWFADDVHPNATGATALAHFLRQNTLHAVAVR